MIEYSIIFNLLRILYGKESRTNFFKMLPWLFFQWNCDSYHRSYSASSLMIPFSFIKTIPRNLLQVEKTAIQNLSNIKIFI